MASETCLLSLCRTHPVHQGCLALCFRFSGTASIRSSTAESQQASLRSPIDNPPAPRCPPKRPAVGTTGRDGNETCKHTKLGRYSPVCGADMLTRGQARHMRTLSRAPLKEPHPQFSIQTHVSVYSAFGPFGGELIISRTAIHEPTPVVAPR